MGAIVEKGLSEMTGIDKNTKASIEDIEHEMVEVGCDNNNAMIYEWRGVRGYTAYGIHTEALRQVAESMTAQDWFDALSSVCDNIINNDGS